MLETPEPRFQIRSIPSWRLLFSFPNPIPGSMQTEQKSAQVTSERPIRQKKIYRPPCGNTVLHYSESPRLPYRARTAKEMERAVHCPDLKCLLNDISFLTQKCKQGDVVIYVGNNVGCWLPMVAKMFPTLQFLVYDGNPVKMAREMSAGRLPDNVHLKASWFSEVEAGRYLPSKAKRQILV